MPSHHSNMEPTSLVAYRRPSGSLVITQTRDCLIFPSIPPFRKCLQTYPMHLQLPRSWSPAMQAGDAILSTSEAEISLIVAVTQHIPVHDMYRVQAALKAQSKSQLLGPNCAGIISPADRCRIGIMPQQHFSPGVIGIVSKSGTLLYEAAGATTREDLGQSLCIGVGGDMLSGTSLKDGLEALLRDQNTKGILMLGEIGGDAELEAADFLQSGNSGLRGKRHPCSVATPAQWPFFSVY